MKSLTPALPFDRYEFYKKAVQSPETDVEFLSDTYQKIRGRRPRVLHEDFCGTFAVCCEWVKLARKNVAHGVDLDPEPLNYGVEHNLSRLKPSERSRVILHNQNVLSPKIAPADIIAVLNFSYFIFKSRKILKNYFKHCLQHLSRNGIIVLDCFGGPLCHAPNEERHKLKGFTYYWDQKSYDPVTHHAEFAIHFKPDGGKKHRNVFHYDWRMWSVPELRECLEEAGFKRTRVFWEGTSRSGGGNGVFDQVDKGEDDCLAWICYVVGEK